MMDINLTTLSIVTVGVVALYAIWEQFDLQRKKGNIPGPKFVLPFFGSMIEIIQNPFDYYEKQRDYGAISWGAALGKLILFTRDSDMTRKVMDNPQNFTLWLTMGAKQILGDENIAFMSGEPHKNLRKKILPLFTPRSLSIFLRIQEACIRRHLKSWIDHSRKENGKDTDFGEFFETRPLVRDMNLETSSTVFVGSYFDENQRRIAADLFWEMSAGFLTFPVNVPGTQLHKAVKAREALVDMYTECLHKARQRMSIPGETAECMLDVWVEEEQKSGNNFDNDQEIGFHFMDFLFASQDASTSSIVWTIALLESHPDVLAKVIEEQNRVRPIHDDGSEEPMSNELVAKMTYTKQVVKEVLRFRPPATMVPHIAINDSQVGDYEIKKGTVILPSIWSAHKDDFPEAEKFDPERFSLDKERDPKTAKSFLAFGYGPHRCIGQQYAVNHLIAFTAEFARNYEWKRRETAGGDDIVFLPTIFPKDGVLISLAKKEESANESL